MYQNAPASMAGTARSSLPFPVMTIAGMSPNLFAQALQKLKPVHPRQFDVREQHGGLKFGNFASASSPLATPRTSQPQRRSNAS